MPTRLRTPLLFLRTLLCTLSCALLALSASADTHQTLKIATIMPDGSSWLMEMRNAGDQIQQKTQGRVQLKFYPGGVMGNDKTVLRKVRAGQLQGGAFTSGAIAAIYPDVELYSLPLFFRNYAEVDYVRAHMDEKLRSGLYQAGFVTLAISDGGFAYVFSSKPLRRVEDLAGAKMFLPEHDVMSTIALDIAGVSPVPLPTVDVYTALQTGLIDTFAAPPMGAIAFQWHTKVRYLTDVPLMYLTGYLVLDRNAFEKLSSEDQAIVKQEIATASSRLDRENRLGEQNAREALRNQGIEFVMASSEDEIARWHRISEEAIARLRKLGRYSNSFIDELSQHIEAYRKQHRTASTETTAVP